MVFEIKYNEQKSAKILSHHMSPFVINDSVDVQKCLYNPKGKANFSGNYDQNALVNQASVLLILIAIRWHLFLS